MTMATARLAEVSLPDFGMPEQAPELPPAMYRDRLERAAANLDAPTLLVRGGLSDVLTEEGAQQFLAVCPHAEYVSVSDAAHMVAGDRNDIFAGAVTEFLHRRVPPR